jgi:hypothetical protein
MEQSTKPKRQLTEEGIKRRKEGLQKANEVRKMKAEIKKTEKEAQKEALRKAYEEKVLNKKQEQAPPVSQAVEETDKEIYNNAKHMDTESESESESESERPPPKPRAKSAKPAKLIEPEQMPQQPQLPNYKNEYYRMKMERLRQQEEQNNFMQNYQRLPPSAHVADVARQQIKNKIDREVYDRVYKDLFGV